MAIKDLDDEQEILNLIKKHTPTLKNMTLDAFKECGIKIKEHLVFLTLL